MDEEDLDMLKLVIIGLVIGFVSGGLFHQPHIHQVNTENLSDELPKVNANYNSPVACIYVPSYGDPSGIGCEEGHVPMFDGDKIEITNSTTGETSTYQLVVGFTEISTEEKQ